ncbi:MAG: MerR family DNA-binding transcriptional regulator [Actinomycetota bacterium]|nr:MerR family DNA-binding transcriptional regulator [Actinomycetota bacterium]
METTPRHHPEPDHANGEVGEGDLLKVSEVGRRTGLTRKALRHYEAMGLVEPAVRTASGYRLYDDEALRRIELVNRAKVLGLSLVEAKEFLHVAEGCCGENHPELATLVEHKLAETDARLAELGNLRRTLHEVLDRLARTEGQHRCEESLCTCNTPLTIGRRNGANEA